jgi:hypothetical protein
MNSSIVRSVMLAVILQTTASAQTRPAPVAASLCDVFASPAAYDQKLLSIDGVLFPSIHSVFLLSPSCPPKKKMSIRQPKLCSRPLGYRCPMGSSFGGSYIVG